MGIRGRRAAADLATAPVIDIRQERLEPPDHLSADARRRFVELVGACDPGHFKRADLPLLVRYVEADAMAERAERELATSGGVAMAGPTRGFTFTKRPSDRWCRSQCACAYRRKAGQTPKRPAEKAAASESRRPII
jgi:hypothetical protein